MKQTTKLFQPLLLSLMVFSGAFSATSFAQSGGGIVISKIEGTVWSPYRRPVPDLYVELQNENYFSVARMKTNSAGRFSFRGVPTGIFYIKIVTTGTGFLEHVERIVVGDIFGSSSDYLEINLKFDKRQVNSGLGEISEVVFVQEVPAEARRLYQQGAKSIQEKQELGFNDLEEALKIFPTYFDALNTLGQEYVVRKEYQKSLAYLIRAIDVNQRSFSSFYALAYACNQLNHRTEAIEAARGATILQPNSLRAQLLYGTLLRVERSYETAEKALLAAKKLGADKPVGDVYWQLALLYNKLGRNREAADELEAFLKIEPDARDKKEIQALITKLRKDTKQKFMGLQ